MCCVFSLFSGALTCKKKQDLNGTICPRSLEPLFIVSYYFNSVKTSWDKQYHNNSCIRIRMGKNHRIRNFRIRIHRTWALDRPGKLRIYFGYKIRIWIRMAKHHRIQVHTPTWGVRAGPAPGQASHVLRIRLESGIVLNKYKKYVKGRINCTLICQIYNNGNLNGEAGQADAGTNNTLIVVWSRVCSIQSVFKVVQFVGCTIMDGEAVSKSMFKAVQTTIVL